MSGAFELLQTMGRVPRVEQAAVAEQGIRDGRWSRDQVAAFLDLPERGTWPRQRRPRAPAVTRRTRLSRRRCSFSRYVRRFSIDVLVHPGLSTGAVTTLVYLISRCGRHKHLQTCTSWLAADLGVSPRTIQNHYRQLEQAGFLVRSRPDRLGRTTIYLTDLVEVRPAQTDTAQPFAQHGEGAKNSSPTKEIDSKDWEEPPVQGKSPERHASRLSEVQWGDEVRKTSVRAPSAAVSYRSARTGQPPSSSFEALLPRRTCGTGYRRSPDPLSPPLGSRWQG